ncbi:MAG: response regulator [Gammaproteobacteria bacterium]|nr:response regulator [Gammaproteobacteria bacterium]
MMNSGSHKLLIVDDSPVMRRAIAGMFDSDDEVEVIGEAGNGHEALDAIATLNPDVVTLDVNMPGMDGLATIKRLMIQSPKPTVMLSSLTREGSRITFDALRYGAVDFVTKPSQDGAEELQTQIDDIRAKVKFAAAVEQQAIKYIRARKGKDENRVRHLPLRHVVAMGAHEGGYGSLLKIIPHLKADNSAAYLAVLYVPHEYIDAFVDYLNIYSQVLVKKAAHGQALEAGVCYISSGYDYMTVHKDKDAQVMHVRPAPFTSRKGSIDMLLFSVADSALDNAIGVILSGSGDDGAEGLEEVIRVGGVAIAQDHKTCLCKEMAVAAIQRCHAEHVISDPDIASAIHNIIQQDMSVDSNEINSLSAAV